MILPSEIKSRHKIRDAKILTLYAQSGFDQRLIAQKFGLSQARIHQILKANASLALRNADYEKLQRIQIIKSDLSSPRMKEQILDKKDALELLRKEYEGDGKINIVSQFLNIELPSGYANRLSKAQSVVDIKPVQPELPQDQQPIAPPNDAIA